MPSYKDNVRVAISNTPGTSGALTVGAAVDASYAQFDASDDGKTFHVCATQSTGTETFQGVYTHSGTSLSRGTLLSSTSGARINLTSAAVVTVVWASDAATRIDVHQQGFIRGLLVTKNSGGNTLDISAGACYDPSSGKVISYAGTTALSAGTLGANQWNQVYIYDNAGTATIQVVNNADAPSTAYAGTARQGGTNSNRRWIGAFRTNGSSNIVANTVVESANGYKAYLALTRVLNAGVATTYTSVSFATVAPSYVTTAIFETSVVAANAGGSAMSLSLDGSVELVYVGYPALSSGFWYATIWHPISYSSGVPRIFYLMNSASNAGYLDVVGFEVLR